jgi:3-deoxy-D-manno-octulosonic-acid transferase
MGPHTFNFADAAEQAQHHGAAQRVQTMAQAWTATQAWLHSPSFLSAAQQACRQWLAQGQGAARRCAQVLVESVPI